jgi:regulator of sirC expression with transglutaminase-like and TPR domain
MTVPGPERVNAALADFGAVVADRAALRLDDTWLAMSAVLSPSLDVAFWRGSLDALAGACRSATREGVIEHLFASDRLRGAGEDYGDWRNSRIDHVLANGVGIPISLAVAAMTVGRRVGVELAGIGMPAHFLIGDPHDSDWFVDPFAGGEVMDRTGCRDLFRRITGGAATWREDFLRPTPPAAIVVRMLNNLRASFARDNDQIRLALVMRMRAMVTSADSTADTRRGQALFN